MESMVPSISRWRALIALAACLAAVPAVRADTVATIDRVRNSIVAVGTFERARTPQFEFRGTGFVVGDGSLVATNAHVLPAVLDPSKIETLVVVLPGLGDGKVQYRDAKSFVVDVD